MDGPAYPAARAVARRVQPHFARNLAAAREAGREDLAPEPDADAIEALIDAAFWASLRREEGTEPKISLAFVPPESAGGPLTFARHLPLDAAALAKLAPAVERAGIHLGVWREDGGLRVWGTTRSLPTFCFVIEVIGSGVLVVKERGESFGKFTNVAVLEGDQVKVVDERDASHPECPNLLRSLLGVEIPGAGGESVNVLVLLAASMRRHGRGGMLLVVPASSTTWGDSIIRPAIYAVEPAFSELADLLRRAPDASDGREWRDEMRYAVDALAGLTAVDGATIITDSLDLLAFGAKVTRRRGQPPVERVITSEPVEDSLISSAPAAQLGGTRHLSAAQFIHDQRDATALVASQDGRFTVFKWSKREDAVHAHRIEALLL